MMASQEQIEMKVDSPVPGPNSSWFALYVPQNLDWENSFDILVQHVEFRRKCMNQGFDNLLELMRMTRETALKDIAAKPASEHPAETTVAP
jgi:hypothetical protein